MGNFREVLLLDRDEQLPYFVMLSMVGNIGEKTYKKIEEIFDTPMEMFAVNTDKLSSLNIFTKSQLCLINRTKHDIDPNAFVEKMIKKGINYVSCEDNEYPGRLKNIYDKPIGLFYAGKLPPENIPCVGVIGARECSFYGEEVAELLGENLGNYGIPVISGMARGIDSVSQLGALEGGGTSYAILGGGVDVVYPRESRALYERLKTSGGIISEYPIGSEPQKLNFVRRNRLISGLSDTLVVVEAKSKSGTLTTVDFALEQGKDVVAVPGRITDRTSVGCNELIRQGAEIVNDPRQFAKGILKKWGFGDENEELTEISHSRRQKKQLGFLEKTILQICGDNSFLPEELLDFEALKQYANTYEVLTACMVLSFENLLINMGGGRFRISHEGIHYRSNA